MRICLLLVALCSTSLIGFAQENQTADPQLKAVQDADNARVAAMKSPNRESLSSLLSDELHYAHSSGTVDTKVSLMDVLTSGKTKYLELTYEKRDFKMAAPGIVLMTGRAHVRAKTGENTMDNTLSFLAVWRLENGKWRFLAWQSCRMPAPTP